jgi:hypothetical protein
MTKMFPLPYRSPQNAQELTRVTMRVEPGRYGWNRVDTVLIPYGPGSIRVEPARYGFNSVWTRFEIRLCVTVA